YRAGPDVFQKSWQIHRAFGGHTYIACHGRPQAETSGRLLVAEPLRFPIRPTAWVEWVFFGIWLPDDSSRLQTCVAAPPLLAHVDRAWPAVAGHSPALPGAAATGPAG